MEVVQGVRTSGPQVVDYIFWSLNFTDISPSIAPVVLCADRVIIGCVS